MKTKKILILAFLISISLLYGCGDDIETPGGCPTYTHIVQDRIEFHVDYDSILLFLYAHEHYEAPITGIHDIDNHLTDSLVVLIYGYGQSRNIEPDPYIGHIWYSDSLVIWYSGMLINANVIEQKLRPIDRTPPCPPDYYRIDYIKLRHAEDLVVSVDSMIRYVY